MCFAPHCLDTVARSLSQHRYCCAAHCLELSGDLLAACLRVNLKRVPRLLRKACCRGVLWSAVMLDASRQMVGHGALLSSSSSMAPGARRRFSDCTPEGECICQGPYKKPAAEVYPGVLGHHGMLKMYGQDRVPCCLAAPAWHLELSADSHIAHLRASACARGHNKPAAEVYPRALSFPA